MKKARKIVENEAVFNPFEKRDYSEALKKSLNDIDNRNIRLKFKNTEDPIKLVFDSIDQTSLSTLTKDFIQESFTDLVSFISRMCR